MTTVPLFGFYGMYLFQVLVGVVVIYQLAKIITLLESINLSAWSRNCHHYSIWNLYYSS